MSDNDNIIYFFQNGMKSQPRNHQLSNLRFSWPSHPVSCFHQCLVLCQAWMSQSLSCAQSLGIWERCFFFFTGRFGIRSGKTNGWYKEICIFKMKGTSFLPNLRLFGFAGLCFKGLQGFFWLKCRNQCQPISIPIQHTSWDVTVWFCLRNSSLEQWPWYTLIIYLLHIGDSWWFHYPVMYGFFNKPWNQNPMNQSRFP